MKSKSRRIDKGVALLCLCAAICLAVVLPGLADATTHYVWTNSPAESSPYTSWDTAAHNIQSAVNAAVSNDTVCVTNGTYLLSGQIVVTNAVTVISVNGASNTIVNGNSGSRCFYISNNHAVVDGFTVTNGNDASSGGGAYIYGGTLLNCIVAGNSVTTNGQGGGIYMRSEASMVGNCVIAGNYCNGRNSGWGGGGVSCFASGIISNCTIYNNTATVNGDGQYGAGGGGIHLDGGLAYKCTVYSNACYGTAGASGLSGGGGLGLYNSGGTRTNTVMNSTIYSNTISSASGGGVLTYASSNAMIYGCLIYGNNGRNGGGICWFHSADIQNCTVVSNRNGGSASAALYHYGNGANGIARMLNMIVYSNQGGTWTYDGTFTNISLANCDMEVTNFPSGAIVSNCITNNPQFVDFDGGNYRLRMTSPCVNTGTNQSWMTNAVDLDGNARILNGIVDMGAYETYLWQGTIYRIP